MVWLIAMGKGFFSFPSFPVVGTGWRCEGGLNRRWPVACAWNGASHVSQRAIPFTRQRNFLNGLGQSHSATADRWGEVTGPHSRVSAGGHGQGQGWGQVLTSQPRRLARDSCERRLASAQLETSPPARPSVIHYRTIANPLSSEKVLSPVCGCVDFDFPGPPPTPHPPTAAGSVPIALPPPLLPNLIASSVG